MINKVQGIGINTEQQKKNWIIEWYFNNDPMGSIYLATLRNPALVASYQTSPGMLYGTPFATGMENYFQKIKNHFGQSMFDQLVTEFAQQSNLYVDEIKVDEWHIYGSARLGVYEANRTISKRVARDLNNDNQITNNEYVIETPEEVLYLYSSYQLERGAKRYELANHLGNVLTVISDKKTANFTGTTFTHFTAERISATDYSPFGVPLAGRTWNGGEYRFGFNTQERDDEVAGVGNITTAEFWEYDARLGRRWNLDPKPRDWFSTYSVLGCNPNFFIDTKGDYFFGWFGSTSEQRKAAREFQKKHDGGVVNNLHLKTISVTYNHAVFSINPINKYDVLIQAKTVYFNLNGDLRSSEVADYKFIFEMELNVSFGPQIAYETEFLGLKAGIDLNLGSVDLLNLKAPLNKHGGQEINWIGKTKYSKIRQNIGGGLGVVNLELSRDVNADLSGGSQHKEDMAKIKGGGLFFFAEHEASIDESKISKSSYVSDIGAVIKLGFGLDFKIKAGFNEEGKLNEKN